MPVEDHPVHPSTQKGADFRYGCWNIERDSCGYWTSERVFRMDCRGETQVHIVPKWIPNVMSTDCRYDLSAADQNCAGCERRLA